MTPLRTALLASLRASPKAEAFARAVADQRYQLQRIERRIEALLARGETPGRGTLMRIDAVQRRLGRSSAAYRSGRA